MNIYKTMHMEPGFILVKVPEQEKESLRNGIYVPTDTSQQKFNKAKVIAVATGERHDWVDLDTTVIFKQYAGYDMGEGYKVIEAKDVLATIPEVK